ncbi:MAG: RHS repeat-associated core domain-containing protein, partial [Clostridiales bacterium]|nr:RHS repeat-associated core domain-containing protein [Clostridiales bacterium]
RGIFYHSFVLFYHDFSLLTIGSFSGGQVTSTETTNYNYDHNGNLISKATETVSAGTGNISSSLSQGVAGSELSRYNGFNQLMETNADGVKASYAYAPSGPRISKTVGGTQTSFVLDGDNVVLELSGSNVTAKYIRGISLIYSTIGNSTNYYLYNGHGDVIQLVDATGTVAKEYDYDAFGNEKNISESDVNPLRYCGEYYDLETKTYYLRARNYDPITGRFLSEDTYPGDVKDPLSLNLYTYCGNNPIMYTDPSGHRYDDDPQFQRNTGKSSNNKNVSVSSTLKKLGNTAKLVGNKLGETGKAIYNNTYASAGVGGGFAGKVEVVGIGFEAGYSGNFAEVRLDNGKFTFGQSQKLAIEVPLVIETFGFGHEKKYNGDGDTISDEGYKWVDPSVYPDIPISMVSGKLYVMYGGSYDVGIKVVPLVNDLVKIWGKHEGDKK